jgi:putative membrane protein
MRARRPAATACGLLLAAALLAGCAPLAGPAAPPQPAVVSGSRLSGVERAFLARAAARGLYEAEVSRLAANRAISRQVRSYARSLANHHAQGNPELAALMRAKGLQPPTGLAADRATKLHRLSALKPSADFDLGYVRVVGVEDHMATIAMFEQARRDARDRDVRAWIDRTLPVLRSQLNAAQSLNAATAG